MWEKIKKGSFFLSFFLSIEVVYICNKQLDTKTNISNDVVDDDDDDELVLIASLNFQKSFPC